MKKLTEYINDRLIDTVLPEHRIDEMSTLSDKNDGLKGAVIRVYGENDEQGTKTPHFHVVHEDFEFEIYIQHIYELNIWRTKRHKKKSNANTWEGHADIKKAIKKWLLKPYKEIPSITNAEFIVVEWNTNNPNHKITQSYKD